MGLAIAHSFLFQLSVDTFSNWQVPWVLPFLEIKIGKSLGLAIPHSFLFQLGVDTFLDCVKNQFLTVSRTSS